MRPNKASLLQIYTTQVGLCILQTQKWDGSDNADNDAVNWQEQTMMKALAR